MAELARSRAREAERRRGEADLAAVARARAAGGRGDPRGARAPPRSGWPRRSAMPSAAIELGVADGDSAGAPWRCGATAARRSPRCSCPGNWTRTRRRGYATGVPPLEALVAIAAAARRAAVGGGRDRRAAAQRRRQDGAAARGLARPAHAADRDRRRGARARNGFAHRRGAQRAQRRRGRGGSGVSPRWSTSCSICRCSRPEGQSPDATGSRSRTLSLAAGEGAHRRPRRRPAGRRRRRSVRCAPTPPSSSARSPICSRTPGATPTACPSRCTRGAAARG